MDGAKLQDAIDYATEQNGLAVRIFRYGCLVGEDRFAAANDPLQFESWSLAKSVTSLMFGRAMTKGDISPDDPVGSLLPEADAAHGKVRMVDLLTMTSGVHWNGLRDYNIFTMPDRVGDWLTLPMDHKPGKFFEYAQSAVAILPKSIERATGIDARAYIQRNLLNKVGIPADRWNWNRDPAGNIEGFKGVRMRIEDTSRLGELMRRGGRWGGKRLLSKEYVRRALKPSPKNPCYGWLIWTNNGKPCIGPRITNRNVVDEYGYPGTPRDMFVYSGLFGQIVAVFPSQGVVIARNGQDSPTTLAGATGWQLELFKRVLRSITDEPVDLPDDPPGEVIENFDEGFQSAIFDPANYSQGAFPEPLPAAGPALARAPTIRAAGKRIRGTRAWVRIGCPSAPEGAAQSCDGVAVAKGPGRSRSAYEIAAGETERVGIRLSRARVEQLIRRGKLKLVIKATNDAPGGESRTRKVIRFRDAADRDRKGF